MSIIPGLRRPRQEDYSEFKASLSYMVCSKPDWETRETGRKKVCVCVYLCVYLCVYIPVCVSLCVYLCVYTLRTDIQHSVPHSWEGNEGPYMFLLLTRW